jgi:hypothetical protein
MRGKKYSYLFRGYKQSEAIIILFKLYTVVYIRLNDIVPLFSFELLLWKSKDAGLYKKVLTPIFGMAPFSLRIHQWWTSLVCSVVLSSIL